jgi:uncharacterized membrane protein
MNLGKRHLVSVIVVAVGLGIAVLTPAPVVIRVVLALPLVLFLPGYALVAAMFARAPVERAVILLLSISLSLSMVIIGGFTIQWVVDLDRFTGGAALSGVTIAAAVVALLRRPPTGPSREAVVRAVQVRPAHVVLLMLAVAFTGAAIALARTPLPAKGVRGYTVLWMLPTNDGSRGVRVGVMSSELDTTTYRLEIERARQPALVRRLALRPGDKWESRVAVGPSATRIVALLYRRAEPNVVYRRVRVLLPSAPADRPCTGRCPAVAPT